MRPVPKEAIEEALSHMLGYAAHGVRMKMYADSARAYRHASDIHRWMESLAEKPIVIRVDTQAAMAEIKALKASIEELESLPKYVKLHEDEIPL